MRCLYVGAAALTLALSSAGSAWACRDEFVPPPLNPPAQQQYVPQNQAPVQLASAEEGMRLAGAGLGGALLAGTVT